MYTNEILEEKFRVQKRLSDGANDVDDYIKKSNDAGKQIMEQYGFTYDTDESINKLQGTKSE